MPGEMVSAADKKAVFMPFYFALFIRPVHTCHIQAEHEAAIEINFGRYIKMA